MEKKILYIEKKPINREMIFNNKEEYHKFWNPYFNNILEEVYKIKKCYDITDFYIYSFHLLNKDGSIRKYTYPSHLLTKKSRDKQKRNFLKYCEKRKKETKQKYIVKRKAELNFKINQLKTELKNLK